MALIFWVGPETQRADPAHSHPDPTCPDPDESTRLMLYMVRSTHISPIRSGTNTPPATKMLVLGIAYEVKNSYFIKDFNFFRCPVHPKAAHRSALTYKDGSTSIEP
jgi:hypothetical protein